MDADNGLRFRSNTTTTLRPASYKWQIQFERQRLAPFAIGRGPKYLIERGVAEGRRYMKSASSRHHRLAFPTSTAESMTDSISQRL